jgi:hypothetical protein
MRAFRALRQIPPTADSFRSYRALGKAPTLRRGRTRDSYDAVSMYASLGEARAAAVTYELGDWVVELDIPDDGRVEIGTINRRTGHVDVFGTAEFLEGCVVEHYPVKEVGDEDPVE